MRGSISKKNWGKHADKAISLFRMENSSGAYVELTNYGATIVSVVVPDQFGKPGNVVLGFPTATGYLNDTCYLGATIGRYANRIAKAAFTLANQPHHLDANDGSHSNHGGFNGFNKQAFDATVDRDTLTFRYTSTAGAGGYPGNLHVEVGYRWSEANELTIRYWATTDKQTILNMTNHAYFNLSAGQRNILGHTLHIESTQLVDTDGDYIPTGAVVPSGDLAFTGLPVRTRMLQHESGIRGLNHCYVLNKSEPGALQHAARLQDPPSGRTLDVHTTYPGLLLYTGDFLHSTASGHDNRVYKPFDGLCLECQYFPDSPNHPNFPSTVLDAGDSYHEQISYKFSTPPV